MTKTSDQGQTNACADSAVFDQLADLTSAFTLSILNASPDCIKLIEMDGSLAFMNVNGQCAMEIDDFEKVSSLQWSDLMPATSKPLVEAALETARGGQIARFDAFCPTAKGAKKWWNISVAPIMGRHGKVERIIATSRDITDRVRQENIIKEHERKLSAYASQLLGELDKAQALLVQRDLLAREVDHRVSNSFSLISGFLRLQSRAVGEGPARQAIEDAANRVQTVARVHEHLQHDEDLRAVHLDRFLPQICEAVLAGISDDQSKITAHICTAKVENKTAIALGLITTELVSNAVKHGAADACRITVSLSRDDATGKLTLSVEDAGKGLPDGYKIENSTGLGMKICRTYASQLGGTITHGSSATGGARFSLEFTADPA